ncbi:MAG TPA: NIPSNAP family protein [Ramlibacter sp.]|uniref:NIPSNAP family protein n=1 Tax=Ramlibacter sp. TaxID=1917967 RepID=UPI002D8012E4|nr:NIPSNAP family protein [Ramlibacter sp.]HET8746414.1 NIPSNAP family protein [Ramlibacter sp.]
MLVEMRSYVLHPGKLPEFMRLMTEEGIAIERPVLGNLLGFYSSEIGNVNKVVHLWGYASFEERQRRRALLAASPEWAAFVPKVLPLIRDMQNELLNPAPFSPETQ